MTAFKNTILKSVEYLTSPNHQLNYRVTIDSSNTLYAALKQANKSDIHTLSEFSSHKTHKDFLITFIDKNEGINSIVKSMLTKSLNQGAV